MGRAGVAAPPRGEREGDLLGDFCSAFVGVKFQSMGGKGLGEVPFGLTLSFSQNHQLLRPSRQNPHAHDRELHSATSTISSGSSTYFLALAWRWVLLCSSPRPSAVLRAEPPSRAAGAGSGSDWTPTLEIPRIHQDNSSA